MTKTPSIASGTWIRNIHDLTQHRSYSFLASAMYKALPSIPSAPNILRLRTLIVVLKSLLAYHLYAMHASVKVHGYSKVLPPKEEDVEWDGLCSHEPLEEDVEGEFNLTDRQLDAMAAQGRRRTKRTK